MVFRLVWKWMPTFAYDLSCFVGSLIHGAQTANLSDLSDTTVGLICAQMVQILLPIIIAPPVYSVGIVQM